MSTQETQFDQLCCRPATAIERNHGGLRRFGRRLAITTGTSTSTWIVAYLIDRRLGVAAAVLSALFGPLGRAVSNPKLIVSWLDEAATVPGAVTRLLISIESERRRWRQRRGGGGSA